MLHFAKHSVWLSRVRFMLDKAILPVRSGLYKKRRLLLPNSSTTDSFAIRWTQRNTSLASNNFWTKSLTAIPPLLLHLPSFFELITNWVHHILGPMTSWTTDMLTGVEIVSATLWERVLPFADAEMKFILARLTAIAAFLDDSITDKAVHDDINEFACRAYLGEAQPDGVLALFYQCLQELSKAHEGDAVLRCLAVT